MQFFVDFLHAFASPLGYFMDKIAEWWDSRVVRLEEFVFAANNSNVCLQSSPASFKSAFPRQMSCTIQLYSFMWKKKEIAFEEGRDRIFYGGVW